MMEMSHKPKLDDRSNDVERASGITEVVSPVASLDDSEQIPPPPGRQGDKKDDDTELEEMLRDLERIHTKAESKLERLKRNDQNNNNDDETDDSSAQIIQTASTVDTQEDEHLVARNLQFPMFPSIPEAPILAPAKNEEPDVFATKEKPNFLDLEDHSELKKPGIPRSTPLTETERKNLKEGKSDMKSTTNENTKKIISPYEQISGPEPAEPGPANTGTPSISANETLTGGNGSSAAKTRHSLASDRRVKRREQESRMSGENHMKPGAFAVSRQEVDDEDGPKYMDDENNRLATDAGFKEPIQLMRQSLLGRITNPQPQQNSESSRSWRSLLSSRSSKSASGTTDGYRSRLDTKFENLNASRRKIRSTNLQRKIVIPPPISDSHDDGDDSERGVTTDIASRSPNRRNDENVVDAHSTWSPTDTQFRPTNTLGDDISSPSSGSVTNDDFTLRPISARLVTAEVFDVEAKREELRLQAEKDAEARILASAVMGEAKIIPSETGPTKKYYFGFGLILGIVIIVVVVIVASVFGKKDGSSSPHSNTNCRNAVKLTNFTRGTLQGEIISAAGKVLDTCQVRYGEGYGLWYYLEGDGSRLSASTCVGSDLSPDSDTQIMLFSGSCDNLLCIAGSDEVCGSHGAVGWVAEKGKRYYLVVKGYRISNFGSFTLTLDSMVKGNDRCESAREMDTEDSPLFGSTRNLTFDDSVFDCEKTRAVAPGAWFRTEGDGNVKCASATSDQSASPDFPLQLSIYEGNNCSDLACVGGVVSSELTPWQTSQKGWLSKEGISYYLFVHGNDESSEGDFILNLGTTPANGICETAEELIIGDVNMTTSGTIHNACYDDMPVCSDVLDHPGVWYAVNGTGDLLVASVLGIACQDTNADFVSQVSVFAGTSCSSLDCVAFFQEPCTERNNHVVSQWYSKVGEQYYLYVQSTDESDFKLTVENLIPDVADTCDAAILVVARDESIVGTTMEASQNVLGDCSLSAPSPGVFYLLNGTGESMVASTCYEGTNFSTAVTVLTGSCDNLECANATTTISCDGVRSISYWETLPSESYYIYIHGGSSADRGRFVLTVDKGGLGVENNFCGTAVPLSIPSQTVGSTLNATLDDVKLCHNEDTAPGDNTETAPGVWYSVVGRGTNVKASLCGENTNYDTQIYVFSGDCVALTCEAMDDDACDTQSEVIWTAQESKNYFILVSGFRDAVGNFELVLEEVVE